MQKINPSKPIEWGNWTYKVGDKVLFNESRRFGNVLYNNLKGKEICVRTTEYYTLEPEIVNTGDNYKILKNKYGDVFGWNDMTAEQLTEAWKNAKATDMFTICKDLASGELEGFQMPKHIQDVIDFLSQESEEVL